MFDWDKLPKVRDMAHLTDRARAELDGLTIGERSERLQQFIVPMGSSGEPLIQNGDRVVIDTGASWEMNEFIVVNYEGWRVPGRAKAREGGMVTINMARQGPLTVPEADVLGRIVRIERAF